MLPVKVAKAILRRVLKYTGDLVLDRKVAVLLEMVMGKLLEVLILRGSVG